MFCITNNECSYSDTVTATQGCVSTPRYIIYYLEVDNKSADDNPKMLLPRQYHYCISIWNIDSKTTKRFGKPKVSLSFKMVSLIQINQS